MNTKHYLVISGTVGGVIGSLLTALLVSLVTAQFVDEDKFGDIECTSLRVVDAAGKTAVWLRADEYGSGGNVHVCGKDGGVWVGITKDGGVVSVSGKDVIPEGQCGPGFTNIGPVAELSADEHSGYVRVWGKDGLLRTLR